MSRFPPSNAPWFAFAETLEGQEEQFRRVMLNMNPARPTGKMGNYLSGFFGGREGWLEEGDGSRFARDWDQILTLPRRLTLRGRHKVDIEPAGAIESLRSAHRHLGRTVVAPNQELVLDEIGGDAIELNMEVDPMRASLFEVDVLRSPSRDEYTRICLYHRRGFKYRDRCRATLAPTW